MSIRQQLTQVRGRSEGLWHGDEPRGNLVPNTVLSERSSVNIKVPPFELPRLLRVVVLRLKPGIMLDHVRCHVFQILAEICAPFTCRCRFETRSLVDSDDCPTSHIPESCCLQPLYYFSDGD